MAVSHLMSRGNVCDGLPRSQAPTRSKYTMFWLGHYRRVTHTVAHKGQLLPLSQKQKMLNVISNQAVNRQIATRSLPPRKNVSIDVDVDVDRSLPMPLPLPFTYSKLAYHDAVRQAEIFNFLPPPMGTNLVNSTQLRVVSCTCR